MADLLKVGELLDEGFMGEGLVSQAEDDDCRMMRVC